jgi:AraC-like DNA-binding protein
MDRHEVPDNIHAEHVAQMHQADMKIQHLYGCKGLTYWCDENRKTAFCLIEAPNKKALQDMHDHAHGAIPHQIIEVDDRLVESFLGRIEDPENTSGTELNVITESAFRFIMVISFDKNPSLFTGTQSVRECAKIIEQVAGPFQGSVVEMSTAGVMLSFATARNAVKAAVSTHAELKKYLENKNTDNIQCTISLSAGSPVTDKDELFGETITLARRMCMAGENCILVTAEVKSLYEDETLEDFPRHGFITTLRMMEIEFLTMLMDYTEQSWNETEFKITDLSKNLGYSKSQLYRKIVSLTGQSPNTFIKKFRLKKALELIESTSQNIAEIAFDTGFNSPSYFSKCFYEAYGILPSAYAKRLAEVD